MLFFLENSILSLALILPLLISVAFFTLSERKLMASIQRRTGPAVVGVFGLLQPFADGLKLIIKETVVPSKVQRFLFIMAPGYSFFLSLLPWAVIPFSKTSVFVNTPLSLLFVLTISSLGVYGVVIAGWVSNSRYAFLGAIRTAAQLVSYELPLGMVITIVAISTGSFNLIAIVQAQIDCWLIIPLFPLFLIFLFLILVETNRSPSDLPESESELVAGYSVDYSAIGFAMFFLGEYSSMLMMSALTIILFLGGWLPFMLKISTFIHSFVCFNQNALCQPFILFNFVTFKSVNFAQQQLINLEQLFSLENTQLPFLNNQLDTCNFIKEVNPILENNFIFLMPEIIFSLKLVSVAFFFIWIRATLPRMRYDFLMLLCWKKLLPITFAFFIVVTAFLFNCEGLPLSPFFEIYRN